MYVLNKTVVGWEACVGAICATAGAVVDVAVAIDVGQATWRESWQKGLLAAVTAARSADDALHTSDNNLGPMLLILEGLMVNLVGSSVESERARRQHAGKF